MKLIAKITDIDIGEQSIELNDPIIHRRAVRTILLNDFGKISLLHKSNNNQTR